MKLYKCHLVSKVILKQFSINKIVRVFRKQSGENGVDHITRVAFIELPREDFNDFDTKWGKEIENEFGRILQRLGQDHMKILRDDRAIEVIKHLMALQFVRGIVGFSRLTQGVIEQEQSLTKNVPEEMHTTVQNIWRGRVRKFAPELIDGLVEKTFSYLKKNEIEAVVPMGRTNFIIGDVPIINFYVEKNKQFITNVAVRSSEAFILPVAPRLAFSIAPKRGVWRLDAYDVRKLNKLTKKIAVNEFYARPLLGDFC